jgi:hypothetical protein
LPYLRSPGNRSILESRKARTGAEMEELQILIVSVLFRASDRSAASSNRAFTASFGTTTLTRRFVDSFPAADRDLTVC